MGRTGSAAGNGVVFYAGPDTEIQFGPIFNYYGNLVVIQHDVADASGQPVYTVYGHMARVEVASGQTVAAGDKIGIVGGTGVALGPHLHFEVRVGDPYNFYSVRNPELWIRPYGGYGTLAGRVTDSNGAILYDVTLTIQSARITRYAFSYAGTEVSGDSVFNENFTLGDLPADWYTVTVGEGGRVRFRQLMYVYANRTTWLNVVLN
ncbi:MAG: peptidoglycan DD-metalloendopeptidase family protein [Chloroflexi bacterium]|nr:peptidoglycan DD-metalloendopeptidase family protein [Chloroflexota bacterium]